MNRMRVGSVFALGLLLFTAGCDSDVSVRDNPFDPEGSDPAPATMRGKVVADGRPILPDRLPNEGILVRTFLESEAPVSGSEGGVAPESERTALTDAEGLFLLNELKPGVYRVVFEEQGFQTEILRNIAVPLASNVELGTINLTKNSETENASRLTGRVLLEGLEPTAPLHGGISVRTVGWPFDVLTSPDGTFQLPISDGLYDIEISFPNYETVTLEGIEIGLGEFVTLDGDPATPEPDPVVLLSNPGSITGVVERELCSATPPVTYEAGDGVVVSAGVDATPLYSAAADPTGAFTVGGMTAGIYRVDLSLAGWEPLRLTGNVVAAGQITDLGTLRISASRGAIMGRIELSGAADHSGTLVQVNGTNFVTLTSSDGTFRIEGVCAGSGYEIVATRDGYVTTSISGLTVTAGEDTRVVDAAGNDPVLERQQGGLTLNGGFPYVNDLDVGFQLDAPAGTTHMRFSEDAGLFSSQGDPADPDPATNGGWIAYSVSGTFSLSNREGTHSVTAQVYGNGAFSGLIQGTVVLDQTPPQQPSIIVEDDSGYSNDLDGAILMTLTASEAAAPGVDVTSGLSTLKFFDTDLTTCATPPCAPLQSDWDAATAIPYNRTVDHPVLDPQVDGAKEVWVTFSDRAGNWSAPVVADFILDRLPPDGISISINNGDAFARSDRVSVALGVTGVDTGDEPGLQMRLANDSAFLGSQWQPFTPILTWFLDAQTDGQKEVWVQFRDAAGNITFPLNDAITLDRALPIALSFDIVDTNSNVIAYTNDQNLHLRLSAADSTQMQVSTSPSFLDPDQNPVPWVGYAANYDWTLPALSPGPDPAELRHVVYVQFRDDADNRSAVLSSEIVFDKTLPTVAGAVLADGVVAPGSGYTHVTTTDVTLLTTAIPGPLDAHQVRLEVASFDPITDLEVSRRIAMDWSAYSPSQVLTLDTTEGHQQVIVTLRDAAGNLSLPVAVDVVLDATAPAITEVVLGSQAARIDGSTGLVTHTGVTQVSLTFTVSNAADAAQMRVANRADFAGAIWQPFAAAIDWTLQPVDQLHTVHVQLRDIAGNIGAGQVSVTLDRAPPTGVSVSIDGGNTYSQDLLVDLSLAATDVSSGLASVEISNDPGFTVSQLETWPTTGGVPDASHNLTDWSLEPVDGLATIYTRFTDAVGNRINAAGTIIVDREAPVGSVIIDSGAPYATGTAVVLRFSAPADTTEVLISNSAIASCDTATGYTGYSLTSSWTLDDSSGDGTKTVSTCLRDAAGNTTAAQDEIVLDTTDPSGTVSIDGAASHATATPVTLSITADTDVTAMAVGNGTLDCSTAAFEPFAGVRSWVLTTGDATKTVVVCFRDAAGRLGSAQDTIILDTTVPSGSIALETGATVTDATSVAVDLTFAADTTGYALANGALDCGVASYTVTTGTSVSTTWSLPAGDGVKTVVVCFEDAAGNAASYAATITLDQTAPAGALSIDAGAGYTDAIAVQLQITAPGDAAQMVFSNTPIASCAAATGWQPFAPSRGWNLSSGDGTKTVHGCLRDGAGNTAALSDEIVLDTAAPAGTLSLQGDTSGYTLAGSGAGFTFSTSVQALLSAPSDTAQVALADGPTLDCATASYQAYAGVIPHTLPAVDGSKTVSVCFKDAAGNTAGTSAAITLDTAPPTLGLTLESGAAYTTASSVAAALTFLDDTNGYALAESSLDCAGATYTPVTVGLTSAADTLSLSAGDGTKSVVACVREAAGRVASTSGTIIRDTTLPTGTISIDDGAAYTTTTTVSLRFVAPADTTGMSVANAATLDCATASYVGFASPFTWSLAAGGGPKSVTVCFEDAAGNRDFATDTITLDVQNPTGSMTIDGGATHTQNTSVVLDLTASSDVTGLAVAEAATLDCAAATYQPFASSMSFTLSAGLSSKNLVACFRDASGRTGSTSASIILDSSSPNGAITLAGGDTHTTGTTVAVALTFPNDTTGYALGEGVIDCDAATYTSVTGGATTASTTFTLPAGDGTKTVSACFTDAAANRAWSADTIILDTSPPSGTVSIDLGAAYNTTGTASLSFSAPSDTLQMAVVNGAVINCGTATYQSFTSPLAWPLPAPDGTKTVSACFRDAAGLTASTQDTIVRDTSNPAGTLVIQGDTSGYTLAGSPAGYTFSAGVSLALSAPADTTELAVGNGATINCGAVTYQPFAGLVAHTLPGTDGTKSVSVCFKDAAGRTSSATDAIILDSAPPTGTLSLDSGNTYSPDTSVAVGLSFLADTNGYALGEGAIDCVSATYTSVTVGNTSASTAFTVSSGDGLKSVVACIREAGGRVVQAQDTITLDATPPTGIVSIDNGAAYDTDGAVTLSFSAPADTAELAVVNGASINCTTATYQGYVTSLPWSLPGLDGSKTVSVCFRDGSGNTASTSDSIILDTSSPTTGTVSIAAGATYATGTVVSLDLSAPADVFEVAVANAASLDCATASYGPFTSPRTWVLTAGDGGKTVTACFRDAAGLFGSASDTITLDTSAPSGTISLASAQAFATSTPLDVDLTFPNDTAGYALAEGSLDCGSATYTPIVLGNTLATTTFTPSSSDGVKTVIACFKDAAGNTGSAVDTVTLDTSPPAGSVSIEAGATYATSTGVTLSLSAPSDTTQMAVLETSPINCASGALVWEGFATTKGLTLGGQGVRTVSVCFRDGAGLTASASDSIIVDSVDPTGSVAINNGDSHTRTTSVNLSIGADADVIAIAVADGGTILCGSVTYEPFSASRAWTLPAGAGGKTVSVCLKDAAGNTTSVSDTITYDPTPPSTATLEIDSGNTYTTDSAGQVTLTLTTPETVTVAIGNESLDCASATYGSFQGTVSNWNLQNQDGVRTVVACFRDAAGWVVSKSDDIILDRQAPTVTLTIEAGATHTSDDLVDLAITASSDVTLMAVIDGSLFCSGATYIPFASTVASYDLDPADLIPGNDGYRYVRVCVQDAAGQTGQAWSYIVLDRVNPAGTMVLAGGATHTPSRSVTVELNGVSSDVTEMAIAETSLDCSSAAYGAYSSAFPFTLSDSDVLHTVLVCLKDKAGRTTQVSDTITLDRGAPSGSVSLDSDATWSTDLVVSALVSSADATQYAIAAETIDCSAATYSAISGSDTANVSLIDSDGTRIVVACLKDAAGNVATVSDTINLDTTAPTFSSISSDEAYSSDDQVDWTIVASDNMTLTQMRLSRLSDGSDGVWEAYNENKTWDMNGTDPDISQVRNTFFWVRDAAGNVSVRWYRTIRLDFDDPQITYYQLRNSSNTSVSGTTINYSGVYVRTSRTDPVWGTSSVVGIRIGEDPALTGVEWRTYTTNAPYTLSGFDGPKTVYIQIRDSSGRVSAIDSDTVALDTLKPAVILVDATNPANDYTNSTSINLDIVASDNLAVGAELVARITEGSILPPSCVAGSYTYPFPGSCTASPCVLDHPRTISATLGWHYFWACVEDAAGNRSSSARGDKIYFDNIVPPQVTGLVLSPGSRQMIVTWGSVVDAHSGLAGFELDYDTDPTFGSAVRVNTVEPSVVLEGLDNRIEYHIRVRAVDRAGNRGDWSNPATDVLGFGISTVSDPVTDQSGNQPELIYDEGVLYQFSRNKYTSSEAHYLRIGRCEAAKTDCKDPSNWLWMDDSTGGRTVHSRRLSVEVTPEAIFVATILSSPGGTTYSPHIHYCRKSTGCDSISDWYYYSLEPFASNIVAGPIALGVTTTQIIAAYYIDDTTDVVRIRGCNLLNNCTSASNWSSSTVDVANPDPPDGTVHNMRPAIVTDERYAWIFFSDTVSLGGFPISYSNHLKAARCDTYYSSSTLPCSVATHDVATGGYRFTNLEAAVAGGQIYLTYSASQMGGLTLGGQSQRVQQCALSSLCDNSADWSAYSTWASGYFFSGAVVGPYNLDASPGALNMAVGNFVDRTMEFRICENPGAGTCLDSADWRTMTLADGLSTYTYPGIASYGNNVAISWLDPDDSYTMALPRVHSPVQLSIGGGHDSLRANWTPNDSVAGNDLLYTPGSSTNWTSQASISDPYRSSTSVPVGSDSDFTAALRGFTSSGEQSDDSLAFHFNALKEIFPSESVTYGTPYATTRVGNKAVQAVLWDDPVLPGTKWNAVLTHCDPTVMDCTNSANWTRTVAINQADSFTDLAMVADATYVFVVASDENSGNMWVGRCAWSTLCNSASDWSNYMFTSNGERPRAALGNGRLWVLYKRDTAQGAQSTNDLSVGHCPVASCTTAGNWIWTTVTTGSTSWRGHDVDVGYDRVTMVRATDTTIDYSYCYATDACSPTPTPVVIATPATPPQPDSVRIAAHDLVTNRYEPTVVAVWDETLQILRCPFYAWRCDDGPSYWGLVPLGPSPTDLGSMSDIQVGPSGSLFVFNGARDQIKLWRCNGDCFRRQNWNDQVIFDAYSLTEAEYNGRNVHVDPSTGRFLFGTAPATSLFGGSSRVFWNGLYEPQ